MSAQPPVGFKTAGPTREEMIEFMQSGRSVIRPITAEDAKKFIQMKYGKRDWVEYLLSRMDFVYSVRPQDVYGAFDPKEFRIVIPEYSLHWNAKEILKNPRLKKEWLKLRIQISRRVFEDDVSDELIRTIYASMQKNRAELESPERKRRTLDDLDHEIGHAILDGIRQGRIDAGVPYGEIEAYLVQRMRGKKKMLEDIARTYIGVHRMAGRAQSAAMVEQEFFRLLEAPSEVHPRGEDVLARMDKADLPEHDVMIYGAMTQKGAVPTLEEIERNGSLSQATIEELKALGIRDIREMDGKSGLRVNQIEIPGEGIAWNLWYSSLRKKLMQEYGLSSAQYQRLERIYWQQERRTLLVSECFSRLLDSLMDGSTRDDIAESRLGINRQDLDFFSRFVFNGKLMFSEEIERIRKKLGQRVPRKVE